MPQLIHQNTQPLDLPTRGLIRLPIGGWRHLAHNGQTFNLRQFTETGTVRIEPPTWEHVWQLIDGGTHFSNGDIRQLLANEEIPPVANHAAWQDIINRLNELGNVAQGVAPAADLVADTEVVDAVPHTRDFHSGRTRVAPTFNWLTTNGGSDWPAELLNLAAGGGIPVGPGAFQRCSLQPEERVPASTKRLAWLIRNVYRLSPKDGRLWQRYDRVTDHPQRQQSLATLEQGNRVGVPRELIMEGSTCCDCLIECERLLIWVEGKRYDCIDTGTQWDRLRDQLARNLDAANELSKTAKKDFVVLVCHEHPLKHHEELLIDGYRRGTWTGGLLHLEPGERIALGQRIRTVTWSAIATQWPALRDALTGLGEQAF